MGSYILALDQSTSGTKAIIFDKDSKLVGRATIEHQQFYPNPGWVEHDAVEIYQNTLQAVKTVLTDSCINIQQITAVSITNQRETALIWDKKNGMPVYRAVVWQCQRAGVICKDLNNRGFAKAIKEKTGLVLSPYFSAPKIKWILDNVAGVREKAEAGELLFGTMDTWLIWNLTGGKIHATDFSNASRTLLFSIIDLKWDQELLDIFTIPASMMPQVKYSNKIFGYTTCGTILPKELPISGVMGDSHGALFGQNCFEEGMAKATYGTGSSIMMNIGAKPLQSQNGIVTSIAWGMDSKINYVFEGNINCTGDTIKWLADNLGLIRNSKESEHIAALIDDNDGVYIVPAFVGLGAPYWDSEARASITGITRGTQKAHIVRAAEESIAYQIKDVIDLMVQQSGISLRELRVDGGPTKDNFLMQFQADMLEVDVVRNRIEELSALGSAYMAGLAVGLWKNQQEIKTLRIQDATFSSRMDNTSRERLYRGWKEAVRRTLSSY
ncbi:MAG TPA: glycerol kinase [Firmicutes bacterium]|jgi:glycerol kinase|nr:glycerol kinase [Bacillota bacterium]